MEKVALLQSRMAKRKKKTPRIRAVDDAEDRPAVRQNKQNKPKKNRSNFANDLTDTSKAATKRLRYDANRVQKGKGLPTKGKGQHAKGRGPQAKGKGPAKGKGKNKAFGKPQAPKQGHRKNK